MIERAEASRPIETAFETAAWRVSVHARGGRVWLVSWDKFDDDSVNAAVPFVVMP